MIVSIGFNLSKYQAAIIRATHFNLYGYIFLAITSLILKKNLVVIKLGDKLDMPAGIYNQNR